MKLTQKPAISASDDGTAGRCLPPLQPTFEATRADELGRFACCGVADGECLGLKRTPELLTPELFKRAKIIRRFEEKLLDLFSHGKLSGTVHTCIGQELCALAVMDHLEDSDWVFSNHRCHGHYLAWSDDLSGLLAEVMGLPSGICAGRGGSQHIYRDHFLSNGVQGGGVPIAAGCALALKLQQGRAGISEQSLMKPEDFFSYPGRVFINSFVPAYEILIRQKLLLSRSYSQLGKEYHESPEQENADRKCRRRYPTSEPPNTSQPFGFSPGQRDECDAQCTAGGGRVKDTTARFA